MLQEVCHNAIIAQIRVLGQGRALPLIVGPRLFYQIFAQIFPKMTDPLIKNCLSNGEDGVDL